MHKSGFQSNKLTNEPINKWTIYWQNEQTSDQEKNEQMSK